MTRIEEIIAKMREDCCQADRCGDDLCVYPVTYGEAKLIVAEIARLTAERDQAKRIADAYKEAQCKSEARLVEEMEKARGLTAERDAAVSELNAYCLYCGADFGTDEAGAIALGEHIEQCPEHPMQAIKEDRDRYRARAEALERALGKHCAMCARFRLGQECCPGYGRYVSSCGNWCFDEARFAGGKEDA